MVSESRCVQSDLQQVASASVYLFATRYNNKLPWFVSPDPDQKAWAIDALSVFWEGLDLYVFPQVVLLGKDVYKLLDHDCQRLLLIAPGWPSMPWFWNLVMLSTRIPIRLLGQDVSSDSAIQLDPALRSPKLEPPCLAPRVLAIKEQEFSDQVAT